MFNKCISKKDFKSNEYFVSTGVHYEIGTLILTPGENERTVSFSG